MPSIKRNGKEFDVVFREDWSTNQVVVIFQKKVVGKFNEYAGAAETLINTMSLTDGEIMGIYYEYKDRYDDEADGFKEHPASYTVGEIVDDKFL